MLVKQLTAITKHSTALYEWSAFMRSSNDSVLQVHMYNTAQDALSVRVTNWNGQTCIVTVRLCLQVCKLLAIWNGPGASQFAEHR